MSFLDTHTFIYTDGGGRSLLYASRAGWETLEPDIENEGEGNGTDFFGPAVLDRYGGLDGRIGLSVSEHLGTGLKIGYS